MRLAFFSPLSPQRSGISDYSEDLLPFLAKEQQLDIFTEQNCPPTNPKIRDNFTVLPYTEFKRVNHEKAYDVCLYQMGNNPKYHSYMDHFIQEFPGVVILHDFSLQHFYVERLLKEKNFDDYTYWMERFYGQVGRKIADNFRCGIFHDYVFYQLPLWQRVVEPSLGTIVHSSYVKTKMLQYNPSYQVEMIPMGIVPPKIKDYPQKKLREKYNIPQERFVIGAFGYISPGKRIPELLEAFAQFAKDVPEALCLLVGHLVDPEELPGFDMRKLIKELGLEKQVLITGFIPYEDFFDYIALSDICVNLRHPTVRATSANILKIMAFGKPILISDLCENIDLPNTCCIKIPLDESEQEHLIRSFQRLYQDLEYRKQMGTMARQYIQDVHTLDQAAERYLSFCSKILDAKTR